MEYNQKQINTVEEIANIVVNICNNAPCCAKCPVKIDGDFCHFYGHLMALKQYMNNNKEDK